MDTKTAPPSPAKPFVGVRDVAAMLGISPRTLEGWCAQDRMPKPYYRIGGRLMWRPADVETWIETHRVAR